MGVTIPGTTVCGVPLAAAIGAFGGDPQKGLKNAGRYHSATR
ncbi:Putative inner membrane protein [Klebsiella pneumoniae IS53]|nr:Putative inner membrane protein [Klebsiella pneumoniae IS53]CDL63276.1 Putative inner membrane protein [Klebsiella pneumoniae IS39]